MGLDGWLLADFRGSNPVPLRLCGLASSGTRRWFLYIPASGAPRLLVHAIERGTFSKLSDELSVPMETYVGWSALHVLIEEILVGANVIAMETSANNDVPTVDLVGAGTLQLVKRWGQVSVVSSQDLVQVFQAVLSPGQIASHRSAAAVVLAAKDAAFKVATQAIAEGNPVSEFDSPAIPRAEYA